MVVIYRFLLLIRKGGRMDFYRKILAMCQEKHNQVSVRLITQNESKFNNYAENLSIKAM